SSAHQLLPEDASTQHRASIRVPPGPACQACPSSADSPDHLWVLPHEFDVQQDGFALKILSVGKKPMFLPGLCQYFSRTKTLIAKALELESRLSLLMGDWN